MTDKKKIPINEDTTSASTLHPKSEPYDDFQADVDAAIEHFQKLNTKQKERYLDYLQKMLDDSAVWSKGAGVPDKTAERNRTFNRQDVVDLDKEEFDFIQWDNDIADTLESMGFTEEAKQKCGELIYEAIENRLLHGDDEFRRRVGEILEDFTSNPFQSDETINAAELLANRIEELESQIAYVENENRQLYSEISQIHEGTIAEEFPAATERAPKRSTVEQHLFEADEENSTHFYNINMQENIADPQMRQYLSVLERTKR